ncbi:hypothetical protein Dsin_019351 [Dipteronia sinensis]|uniref:Retrotransposon Copia-like N-terminal domain-containing protein n=1 Tax=Dipteronia sinensis TaxID=43782 RepID=A0AAE0A702_9ROSI|nr:hypothetical protein Dsin_019351 [Dipteronia sinensis]
MKQRVNHNQIARVLQPSRIHQVQYSSSLPSIESPVIAKSLNYNLQIKLNIDNYVYWKAVVLPAIRALETEDFINGVRFCPNKYVKDSDLVNDEKDLVISNNFLAWRRLDQFLLSCLWSTVSRDGNYTRTHEYRTEPEPHGSGLGPHIRIVGRVRVQNSRPDSGSSRVWV